MKRIDTFSEIAGIEPDSAQDRLRRTRPDVIASTQATFDALFEPDNAPALTRVEREASALYSATLAKAAEIAAFHRARLIELGVAAEPFIAIGASIEALDLDQRQQAILRHTELLTLHPALATRGDTDALLGAGISPEGVVTIAQLVAFIAFEARTIAALAAITEGATA